MSTKQAEALKRISQSLIQLPTLPTLAARLLELVDNPKTNAAMLAQLIGQDQVITARLLKMCNSAYYGLGREITSIHQAIVLLGFDNVKEISLGVSVINVFKGAQGVNGFDLSGFWDHSAAVGLVARKLARGFMPALSSEAFTAGLLHDIGKVVMIQYLTEDFARILTIARQEGRELYQVERELIGTDHGQVGSWLAQRWKLPKPLQECMMYHHGVDQAEESKPLVAIVALADVLCRILKAGDGGNPAVPRMPQDLRDIIASWGLEPTPEGLKPLLLEVMNDLEQGNPRTEIIG